MKNVVAFGSFCLLVVFAIAFVLPPVEAAVNKAYGTTTPVSPNAPAYAVTGKPTISAQQIDTILCQAASPACHTGQSLYDQGVQHNIDPAIPLGFFKLESDYGTQGEARVTLSLGNIRCEPGYACTSNGYAAFSSWQQGYQAWYDLIAGPLYVQKGLTTIDRILPIYAPPSDRNNTSAYIENLKKTIDQYRSASK